MFRQVLHPQKVCLIASQSLGILIATEKPESRMRTNSKSDAASSSQARLEDAYLGELMDTSTGKPVATKEESGHVDLSGSETEEDVTGKTGRLLIKIFWGSPLIPDSQTARKVQKPKR